jgi:hypothetical protein
MKLIKKNNSIVEDNMSLNYLKGKSRFVLIVILLLSCAGSSRKDAAALAEETEGQDSASSGGGPGKQKALTALHKAVEFYLTEVATEAGYHPGYTVHISSGNSGEEDKWHISGRGPQTVQNATPTVGMAYLEAWEATGDRFFLEAARSAAHGMLMGQMCSGGWDERETELDPENRKNYRFRADGGCPDAGHWSRDYYKPYETGDEQVGKRRNMTNLDNNITQSVVRMMMRVDRALSFGDKAIHDGALHAIDYLVEAQYPIGAWPRNYEKCGNPRFFPVIPASYPDSWSFTWTRPDFYSYYNINDDCTLNVMDAMLEAARIYNDPKYRESAERAGAFLLLAQMPDPQPAWAQQYNPRMHPSWARSMEPPAVSGRESVSVLHALLALYRETGNKKFLEPVPRAVDYLKRSSYVRNGRRLIARFYELRTDRPLYITPGSPDTRKITYSDERIKRGYTFATSAEPLDRIAAEYRRLLAAEAEDIRRPEKLKSLKPFTYNPPAPMSEDELTEKVSGIISALDQRGAWLHPYGRGQSTDSQDKASISSGTFARNISLLCEYILESR